MLFLAWHNLCNAYCKIKWYDPPHPKTQHWTGCQCTNLQSNRRRAQNTVQRYLQNVDRQIPLQPNEIDAHPMMLPWPFGPFMRLEPSIQYFFLGIGLDLYMWRWRYDRLCYCTLLCFREKMFVSVHLKMEWLKKNGKALRSNSQSSIYTDRRCLFWILEKSSF